MTKTYHQHVQNALETYRAQQQARACQPWLPESTIARRRVRITTRLLTMWRRRRP